MIREYMHKFRNFDVFEKIQALVNWFLQALLLFAFLRALYTEKWLLAAVTLIILIITFIPFFLRRAEKLNIPIELELFTTLFIYATLFLGEIQHFYDKISWWDTMLHTLSAVVIGMIGFFIIYILVNRHKIMTSARFMALFIFCFAMMVGVVWEITEYTVDVSLHKNMQRRETGVVDTMSDLIDDAVGALIAATLGFFYMRGAEPAVFNRVVRHFVKQNPELMRRKDDKPL